MRTVVVGPRPAELEQLIERRRRLGQDRDDEVWEGEYHVAPAAHPWHGYTDAEVAAVLRPLVKRAGLFETSAFNLGHPDDYRVPDRGVHRTMPSTTFVPTAALVVEIVSPDDETWNKLDFYAAHGVEELLIIEPREHMLTLLARRPSGYVPTDASAVLGVTAQWLAAQIDWPVAP